MNQRIKELAEQAGFVNLNADYWDCTTDGMKKFAELIVQECATVVERNLFQNIGYNTSRAVKHHFGIGDEE